MLWFKTVIQDRAHHMEDGNGTGQKDISSAERLEDLLRLESGCGTGSFCPVQLASILRRLFTLLTAALSCKPVILLLFKCIIQYRYSVCAIFLQSSTTTSVLWSTCLVPLPVSSLRRSSTLLPQTDSSILGPYDSPVFHHCTEGPRILQACCGRIQKELHRLEVSSGT